MKTRRIQIGGLVVLEVPEFVEDELVDDGTLMLVPRSAPDMVTVRVTTLTFTPKDDDAPPPTPIAETIEQDASAKGLVAIRVGEKTYFSTEEDSVEEGTPIWLRFWQVGFGNNVILFSLCCEQEFKQDPLVKALCEATPEMIASIQTREYFSPTTPREQAGLDAARQLIAQVLAERYDSYSQPKLRDDLECLQRLIDDEVFDPGQEEEWCALGVVFGDVLANELGMDWETNATEEMGVEVCLHLKDTHIAVFARTMIIKRVEAGEEVDLLEMLAGLETAINDLKKEGC